MKTKTKKTATPATATLMDGLQTYGTFQIYVSMIFGVVLGLVCLGGAFHFYTKKDTTLTAQGVVQADSECLSTKDAVVCHTKVTFKDKEGKEHQVSIKSNTSYLSGAKVKLDYDEANPLDAQFCCRQSNRFWANVLLVGAFLLFLASGISFYLRKNKFYQTVYGVQGAASLIGR